MKEQFETELAESTNPSITNPITMWGTNPRLGLRQSLIDELGLEAAVFYTALATHPTSPIDLGELKVYLQDLKGFDEAEESLTNKGIVYRYGPRLRYIQIMNHDERYKLARLEDMRAPLPVIKEVKPIPDIFQDLLDIMLARFTRAKIEIVEIGLGIQNNRDIYIPQIKITLESHPFGKDKIIFQLYPTESGLWATTSLNILRDYYKVMGMYFDTEIGDSDPDIVPNMKALRGIFNLLALLPGTYPINFP